MGKPQLFLGKWVPTTQFENLSISKYDYLMELVCAPCSYLPLVGPAPIVYEATVLELSYQLFHSLRQRDCSYHRPLATRLFDISYITDSNASLGVVFNKAHLSESSRLIWLLLFVNLDFEYSFSKFYFLKYLYISIFISSRRKHFK